MQKEEFYPPQTSKHSAADTGPGQCRRTGARPSCPAPTLRKPERLSESGDTHHHTTSQGEAVFSQKTEITGGRGSSLAPPVSALPDAGSRDGEMDGRAGASPGAERAPRRGGPRCAAGGGASRSCPVSLSRSAFIPQPPPTVSRVPGSPRGLWPAKCVSPAPSPFPG